jgi:hypothetical protein
MREDLIDISGASEKENQYVLNYTAPWEIYSIAFSCRPTNPFRLAIGSLKDDESNFVDFLSQPDRSGAAK